MTAAAEPASPTVALADGTVLRPLADLDELEACVALQRLVWGRDFGDVTSPAILKIVQEVGGVAAGAFGGNDGGAGGELLGFVFGITGVREGWPVHWSHMLAVAAAARGRDLGYHLKLYQRRCLLSLGVETVLWTYDPLVSKNAYLNLARLGARAVCYVRDYYGEGEDSALSAGIGTDRFVVEWPIAEERVAELVERGEAAEVPGEHRQAPVANVRKGEPVVEEPAVRAPILRVEVPTDVQEVRQRSREEAVCWRESTRRAFEALLERGYEVEGFFRERSGQGHGQGQGQVRADRGTAGWRSFYVLTGGGG